MSTEPSGDEPGEMIAHQLPTVRRTGRASFFVRFRQHRGGLIGACVVAFFVLIALAAPLIAPHDPFLIEIANRLREPSAAHLAGTDELGRDVLSRIMFGASISIRAGMAVVILGFVLGVPIGAVSGYVGGVLDLAVQRAIDTLQAFPGVLLVILVAALVGPSLEIATFALGFLAIPGYARLVRGEVLVVRGFAYVEAARTVGCRDLRVLVRHILPNALNPVIVHSSLQSATALLLLAGLSFLGLGAQPPTPEWGAMLAQGKLHLRSAPYLVIFPGLAVSLLVLSLNLIGDALRDTLDPRTIHRT